MDKELMDALVDFLIKPDAEMKAILMDKFTSLEKEEGEVERAIRKFKRRLKEIDREREKITAILQFISDGKVR